MIGNTPGYFIHRKVREQEMVLALRRVVLLHALFSAWCVAQQRTGDGRVILNLGYFATYEGSYVSSGEGAWLHAMVGRLGRCNRSTCGRERAIAYRASAVQHVPAVNAQEMGRRWL